MTIEGVHGVELPGMTIRVRFEGHSDRGSVRRVNEDSFTAVPPFLVVADGMGGHSFGDRGSEAAIAAFADVFASDRPARVADVLAATVRANDAVRALSDSAGTDSAGTASADALVVSGTTLTGVALVDVGGSENYHWMAFNVGDSRTYSWDGRTLTQVTVRNRIHPRLHLREAVLPRAARERACVHQRRSACRVGTRDLDVDITRDHPCVDGRRGRYEPHQDSGGQKAGGQLEHGVAPRPLLQRHVSSLRSLPLTTHGRGIPIGPAIRSNTCEFRIARPEADFG